MGATRVASGQNSGAGGTITVTSTNPIPIGTLIVGMASVGAAALTYSSVADNSGLGNVYTLIQVNKPSVGNNCVLALAIAQGTVPTGTIWTFTLASGSPGGRMGSVCYFDDTLRTPSPPIIDVNNVIPVVGSSNPIVTGSPTDAPELVIFAIGMASSTAGGVNDSISLDGSLTQIDNRNHTGSVTRYFAYGYRYITNSNPINDSATFLASDTSVLGYVSIKLPIPTPPPPGGNSGSRLLMLKV
jgi:hypothetical protein